MWELDSGQAALDGEVLGEANISLIAPTAPPKPWKVLTRTLGSQGTQLMNHDFSPVSSFYKWETEARNTHQTDPWPRVILGPESELEIGSLGFCSHTGHVFIPMDTRPEADNTVNQTMGPAVEAAMDLVVAPAMKPKSASFLLWASISLSIAWGL